MGPEAELALLDFVDPCPGLVYGLLIFQYAIEGERQATWMVPW
jgi:hypothetical protein